MKRTLIALVALSLLPVTASAKPMEWSEIEAVGGLKLGSPYLHNGAWYMPVKADVSGLHGGKTVNSGLTCAVTAHEDNGKVVVTVDSQLASSVGTSSAKCHPVLLRRIEAGDYDVVYRSPSETDQTLGQIKLADKP